MAEVQTKLSLSLSLSLSPLANFFDVILNSVWIGLSPRSKGNWNEFISISQLGNTIDCLGYVFDVN